MSFLIATFCLAKKKILLATPSIILMAKKYNTPMLTVALPTWNNRNIVWLAMEGLCNQQPCEWELIVMECVSPDVLGEAFFQSYSDRLRATGCKRVLYLYSDTRLPLSQKWKRMAKKAKGDYFALQGSDDYPHPSRNVDVLNAKADWYDMQKYYHFDVNLKKLIFYDNLGIGTGFNMAIRTKLLKRLPKEDVSIGVDGYLYKHTRPEKIVRDERIVPGVSTNGANSISIKRIRFYEDTQPPFYPTSKTINDIGLPDEVVTKLIEI